MAKGRYKRYNGIDLLLDDKFTRTAIPRAENETSHIKNNRRCLIMIIKALVAVRAGSQRVKNKNIKPFANSTLLEIKLKQLLRCELLDGVIVNSDDPYMLEIAANMGCETVLREQYYASSSAPMSEVYKNMAENAECDVIVYANVTNPLIKDTTLAEIINFYKEHTESYDSVNSAHPIKEFLFKDNKPINYDLKHQPRSQDLPDIFALNFAVSVISREKMISGMNVVGDNPYIFKIDQVESTDIDNEIDFDFAEYMYNKIENEIMDISKNP